MSHHHLLYYLLSYLIFLGMSASTGGGGEEEWPDDLKEYVEKAFQRVKICTAAGGY